MGLHYDQETGNGPGSRRQRNQKEARRDAIAKKISRAIDQQGISLVLADILNDLDAARRKYS